MLRVRSELRKRKLASVTVERVLNIQGNIPAAILTDLMFIFYFLFLYFLSDNVYGFICLYVCTL